jgi:hypothetical protein
MQNLRILGLAALALTAGLLTACNEEDGNPVVPPVATGISCVNNDGTLAISIDTNCVLPPDSSFSLSGITYVKAGATLTIGAGTTIKGRFDRTITALVVQPGGKLIAIGTAAKPIVFTAGSAAPQRGDFGGVVLLGRADINRATETADIEGLVGVPYGGANDADSSGVLQYVRIEYAGRLIGTNNELNGLTMGGVGSKTKISYVQVYDGLDDCFEWFGGTVSADHLVGTICDDDMFDWDFGWRGNLQFAIGVANGTASSADPNGIEADNGENTEEFLPRSNPKIANLTLIGNGASSLNGIRLRRGTAGQISNVVVTGFKTGAAIRIDGNTSIRLVNNDSLKVSGLYAYANGSRVSVAAAAGLADSVATRAAAVTKIGTWFGSDTTHAGLSLTVWKPAAALAGSVATPAGFATANYIGAFDPASATLWTAGWIKTP